MPTAFDTFQRVLRDAAAPFESCPLGHLVVTLMHALSFFFFFTIWCPMRGQKTTAFFKRHTDRLANSPHHHQLPSNDSPRHQPWQPPCYLPGKWRSGALASSRGTRLPCYLCTWKCLWIQVRDRVRSATRAAVYYTTSEGAPTLKCESERLL